MIGTNLAHYRITAALGAGGMGEVWRATDEKLGREVALKVLPEAFASDPDRLARFEREAKVLASLNHPNIAHLYGLETVSTQMAAGTAAPQGSQADEKGLVGHASRVPDTDVESPSGADVGPNSKFKIQNSKLTEEAGAAEVTFLVMELVEGEDLSERIARGPIPVDEAIPIALQIAEALEAAHEAGIVHRDLKPANIKITDEGTVKVLDFGLAKVLETGRGDPGGSELSTVTRTQAGAILGTAAYMSPEQARGRTADRSADIWSFGVVLWEMLAGRRLFDGSSAAEVRAAVLTEDLDHDDLPSALSWSVRELLRKCLVREPRRRLQHVGDARLVLEDVLSGRDPTPVSAATIPKRRGWLPWLLVGLMAVVAVGAVVTGLRTGRTSPEPREPVQFEIRIPDNGLIARAEIMTRLAVSPDGRRLAFVASVDGETRLYIRELDSLDSTPIEGSDGAYSPFWAPDSRNIGFFSNGRIMRADIAGGPPREICSASVQGRAAWGRDGTIVFAEAGREHSGLARVDATGGEPSAVTTVDSAAGEVIHLWPQFLPDQERVLFLRGAYSEERGEIVRDLMVTPIDGGAPQIVMPLDSRFEVVPSGFLLYVREETLLAQPFDLGHVVPAGEPAVVASRLSYMIQTGFAEFGASHNGVVALHGGVSTTELVLLDRRGREIGRVGDRAAHGMLRLDGTGRLMAVEVYDLKLGSRDIWIHDLELGTARRLTLGASDDTDPMWWPDGQRVVFASDMAGAPDIYRVSLGGGGDAEPIVTAPPPLEPKDVFGSPARVIFMMWSRATNADLWVAAPGEPGSSEPYLKTVHSESDARVSPDGRWVAFTSDETGSFEVYVARAEDASSRRRVSVAGGWSPRWRGDGSELFFLARGGAMVASLDPVNGELIGPPELLFVIDHPVWRGAWDVAPDGRTFIVNRTVIDRRRDPIRVILDWPGLISNQASQGGAS